MGKRSSHKNKAVRESKSKNSNTIEKEKLLTTREFLRSYTSYMGQRILSGEVSESFKIKADNIGNDIYRTEVGLVRYSEIARIWDSVIYEKEETDG